MSILGGCGSGAPAQHDAGPVDSAEPDAPLVDAADQEDARSEDAAPAEDAGPPALHVATTSLDFGYPVFGGQYTRSFAIDNTGLSTLTITSVDLVEDATVGAFAMSPPAPFTVGAGGSLTAAVTLTPNNEKVPTGSLVLHSNDPAPSTSQATIGLVAYAKGSADLGLCVKDPTPPPTCMTTSGLDPLLDFGTVTYGESVERIVALTNVGDSNLPVGVMAVTLTNAAHFAISFFALVDDPAHPGQMIEQATTLPFFVSTGDVSASPVVPPTELRVHVQFTADGIHGDLPHESLVIQHSLAGSPTTIPIVGHIAG